MMTLKKLKILEDSFSICSAQTDLEYHRSIRRINKWVLDQIKAKPSLEPEMKKLMTLYFGHIRRRQSPLENTIMVDKVESSKKKGR